jgi:WD40 repeat protein
MKILKLAMLVLLLSATLFLTNSWAENLFQTAKARIDVQQGAINDMVFSADGRHLAIASTKSLQLYDAKTYKELISFTGHTASVLTVAFSSDGKRLISGGQDETVRLWKTDTGELLRTREEHWGAINALAFSADGEMFWSGSNNDREIRSWFSSDGGKGSKRQDFLPYMKPNDVYTATVFSPDAEILIRASTATAPTLGDGFLIFFTALQDTRTSTILSATHADPVSVLTLHADGNLLATGSADQTIQLWNMKETSKPRHILTKHTGGITAIAFSATGKLIASGSSDKTVQLWDVETGKPLDTVTEHTNEITAVTFSGDKTLASGSFNGTVILWDLKETALTE